MIFVLQINISFELIYPCSLLIFKEIKSFQAMQRDPTWVYLHFLKHAWEEGTGAQWVQLLPSFCCANYYGYSRNTSFCSVSAGTDAGHWRLSQDVYNLGESKKHVHQVLVIDLNIGRKHRHSQTGKSQSLKHGTPRSQCGHVLRNLVSLQKTAQCAGFCQPHHVIVAIESADFWDKHVSRLCVLAFLV